jgi:excisionase family DNA binding protein
VQKVYTEQLKRVLHKKRRKNMFTNFDEMPVTLSVEQAAEVLSIAPVSLYKLIKKDSTFPTMKIGRRIVIPKDALKKWIDNKVNS